MNYCAQQWASKSPNNFVTCSCDGTQRSASKIQIARLLARETDAVAPNVQQFVRSGR